MFIKLQKVIPILGLILILGCDDPKEEASLDNNEEVIVPSAVQLQVVGSLIEGMIVCDSNSSCKQTDSNGMVAFDNFDSYTFKINDINVSSLNIETNRTIVSPYKLFEHNETLAKNFLLVLHAFDKGSEISDEEVVLTFSSYIPKADTIEQFIIEHSENNDTNFSVNEHNISIDTQENIVNRGDRDFTIDVPTKEAYAKLDRVSEFIALANDKNVTLGNVSTKYLLTSATLSSFELGERYRFNAFAKEEEVIVEIYDSQSRTTDSAKLIESDDNTTLVTNLVSIILEE
jgi:hypothetical protein